MKSLEQIQEENRIAINKYLSQLGYQKELSSKELEAGAKMLKDFKEKFESVNKLLIDND